MGEAIVKDGATKLLDQEKQERSTAGKRLNMKSVMNGLLGCEDELGFGQIFVLGI